MKYMVRVGDYWIETVYRHAGGFLCSPTKAGIFDDETADTKFPFPLESVNGVIVRVDDAEVKTI